MGLGLVTGGGSENIKPYVTYDAKAGRLFLVDRTQDNGQWVANKTDITNTAQFVMDMAEIRVGFINFTDQGPIKALSVLGKEPFPARPEGMDKFGKPAFKQGFLAMLAMPKDLGGGIREFSSTAACVIEGIDELHDKFTAAPESKVGKLPVVRIVNVMPIKGAMGTNYKPVFEIVAWVDRPTALAVQNGATATYATEPIAKASVADNYAIVKGVTPPTTGSTQVVAPPPAAAQRQPEPVGSGDFG